MQTQLIKRDIKISNLSKQNKEEDDFINIFASVFQKKEHFEEKRIGNELYFFQSISHDNTKNTISDLTNINHKNNNNLETDQIIKGTEGIDKAHNISLKKNEEKKYISESDEYKSSIHEELSMTKEDQIENNNSKREENINHTNNILYNKKKLYIRGPYKKKNRIIEKAKTDDKCFPFTSGEGIMQLLENRKIKLENIGFKVKRYITDSSGKIKKAKKQRKFKSDDIRKKIKVKFHKAIKDILNENLKKAGSKALLTYLPQSFIGNISRNFNNKYFDLTFEELISLDFSKFHSKFLKFNIEKNKYDKNIELLDYLKNNPEISKNSGFDLVKKMKYRDLLNAYFLSKEFENTIVQLKSKKESDEYINSYIFLAKNYVNYFSNIKH